VRSSSRSSQWNRRYVRRTDPMPASHPDRAGRAGKKVSGPDATFKVRKRTAMRRSKRWRPQEIPAVEIRGRGAFDIREARANSARSSLPADAACNRGDNFHCGEDDDRLHAAVGASAPQVDAGFAAIRYQVGQTGSRAPSSTSRSAFPAQSHSARASMKDSKFIAAIKRMKKAPISR